MNESHRSPDEAHGAGAPGAAPSVHASGARGGESASVAPDPTEVFRAGVFDGRVALVTGGGTGIGFGIATTLARLGAHVVIASRNEEHLAAGVERLRALGARASAHAVDVRDHARVHAMVQDVAAEHGRIDLLVNNAAGNFYAPSDTMSPNAWRAVVEIDLFGTFYCSQAVVPVMRDAGGGCIVNISMTLHYRGWPQMAHATAAKAGIDALTRTLAREWAPHGIRVNAVAPGPIPTEGVRKAFAPPAAAHSDAGRAATDASPAHDPFAIERAMGEYARQHIPLGRWGAPADIGCAVAYLASPAASWITGAIMVVDGGEWLGR
ncbi:MAG TPA: SDR family oxidoreductase [Gemmatimonadaceae bacterium]|nr:SDR family oxidoreductase [Gemmatimonadaceae bacterium]